MNRSKIHVLVILVFLMTNCLAQHKGIRRTSADVFSIGLGVGLDHGGAGVMALYYPTENFGFFAGGGYALAGFACNAGAKLRLTSSEKFQPFVLGMYGHNAVIETTSSEKKLFYGSTVGLGVDIRFKDSSNYFSLAVLMPIKGAELDEYVKTMGTSGVSFNSASVPVGFSIGYRFAIQTNDY